MGSGPSRMSTDLRASDSESIGLDSGSSSSATSLPAVTPAPDSTHGPPSPTDTASANSAAPVDVAALRAAALKSARLKKARASKVSVSNADEDVMTRDKEDGEISASDKNSSPTTPPLPAVSSSTATEAKSSTYQTTMPPAVVSRSTRLKISDINTGSAGEVTFPVSPGKTFTPEEETGIMEIVRNLLNEGIAPDVIIREGAPASYVAKVCEDIVAGSRHRRDLWTQIREPAREDSGTPDLGYDSAGPSRARSPRSPSPDVEVAVSMARIASSSSDSSTEAIIERMVPPQFPPRILPTSSWSPATGETSRPRAQAIRLESYRPSARASNMAGSSSSTTVKTRRHRDLDRATATDVTVLDYGDSSSSPPSPEPIPAPSVPDRLASNTQPDPLAETRRRALESMRRRKTATPSSSVAPTPPPFLFHPPPPAPPSLPSPAIVEEAANLEQQILGSTTEVPMDIDDEVEEGEIPASDTVEAPPLSRETTTRGVKRPLAEDLMDRGRIRAVRPATAKRHVFGAHGQLGSRLVLQLDDDSDSDDDDDEEASPVALNTPLIVIPPEYDTEALLAEKEASIRRLKEQIAARLLVKQTASAANSRSATPTPASRVADAAEAAEGVGVTGVSTEVVQAAVLAAAQEHHERDQTQDEVPMSIAVDSAERPSAAVTAKTTATSLPSSNFRAYKPLLPHYPQLASSAHSVNIGTASLMTTSPQPMATLDWPLVSSIILTHRLLHDKSAAMCRSEAGGGSCADADCSDIHLLRTEPTDDDLVSYATQLLSMQADNGNITVDMDKEPEAVRRSIQIAKEELSNSKQSSSTAPWSTPDGLTSLLQLTIRHLAR